MIKKITAITMTMTIMGLMMTGCGGDDTLISNQSSGEKEASKKDSSIAAEDLLDVAQLYNGIGGYAISVPKNWSEDLARGGLYICGNKDMEEEQRDYFLTAGYSKNFMDLPTSFDDIIEEFEQVLEMGVNKIGMHAHEQTIEKSEVVEVNGMEMLKVEGRLKGDTFGQWEKDKPPWDYKYYAYYTFYDADNWNLKLDNCPFFWMGITELEENYEIMERYVDEAAKTLELSINRRVFPSS